MDKFIRMNRIQCICALVSCIVVTVCVCIGVVMNLTTLHDQNFDNMGLRTFRMFTVNSNILAALSTAVVIPYAIDGIRKKNYHLSDWVVNFLITGTTAAALTFLVSLFILAPVKGFVLIFTGSRFFLHAVCPILAILTFCMFISSHRVTVKESFFALIPVAIYAILYFIMVVVITEQRGGWADFYGFATRIPFWIPAIAILPLTFGITTLLRLWHNHTCNKRRKREASVFLQQYEGKNACEILREMGRIRAKAQPDGNVLLPIDGIKMVLKYANDGTTVAEASRSFIDGYFEIAHKAPALEAAPGVTADETAAAK